VLAYGFGHVTHQLPGFRQADPPDLDELVVVPSGEILGRLTDLDLGHAHRRRRHVDDRDACPRMDPAADDADSADPQPRLLERLPDRGLTAFTRRWRTLPAMFGSCYILPQLCSAHVSKHIGNQTGGSIWATIVPGWITAIATAGLLIGAIITAVYAVRAFGKQSQQLEEKRPVNALQAEDLRESLKEREREAAERCRVQASRVFIWQEYREGNPCGGELELRQCRHLLRQGR
jgi:hypothetical protein